MKKLLTVLFMIAVAIPGRCDGTATLISWPGWTCSSTEDLSLGRKHTSFPLTYLFDGNPATPWVFSGTGKHESSDRKGYAVRLTIDEDRIKPVMVDSIWIMNGYNKSKALFLRNNRITELKLYADGRLLKTVSLSDCMGWHKISIARQYVSDLVLRFTKFAKGRDNDVCVSEIALYDRGKKIDLRMPQVVEFTEGDVDCGDAQEFHVIDRSGKKLETYDIETASIWSPSGRYIAGVDYDGVFWVVNTATAKFVMRKKVVASSRSSASVKKWRGDSSVVVDIETYKSDSPDETDSVTSFKTIRLAGNR